MKNKIPWRDLTLLRRSYKKTPGWEKQIAEEALQQSRQLRHRLEGIESIEELEQLAADTARFYKKINRAWYKGRYSLNNF